MLDTFSVTVHFPPTPLAFSVNRSLFFLTPLALPLIANIFALTALALIVQKNERLKVTMLINANDFQAWLKLYRAFTIYVLYHMYYLIVFDSIVNFSTYYLLYITIRR